MGLVYTDVVLTIEEKTISQSIIFIHRPTESNERFGQVSHRIHYIIRNIHTKSVVENFAEPLNRVNKRTRVQYRGLRLAISYEEHEFEFEFSE